MTFYLTPVMSKFAFRNADKLTSLLPKNNLFSNVRLYSVCNRQLVRSNLGIFYKPKLNNSVTSYGYVRYKSIRTGSLGRNDETPKSLISWRSLGAFVGAGALLLGFFVYLRDKKRAAIDKQQKQQIGKVAIGGRFDLVDHDGKPVKSEDFLGDWLLIYFGFTHCPDVCPEEMEKLAKIADILEKDKSIPRVKPLFISVDPERDTVPVVKKYIREFSDKIIGLTGSLDQVAEVCKAYRVYFSQGPKDEDKDYIVDHTIIIYLVDGEGNFVDYYSQNRSVDEVVNGVHINMLKFDPRLKKGFIDRIFQPA